MEAYKERRYSYIMTISQHFHNYSTSSPAVIFFIPASSIDQPEKIDDCILLINAVHFVVPAASIDCLTENEKSQRDVVPVPLPAFKETVNFFNLIQDVERFFFCFHCHY